MNRQPSLLPLLVVAGVAALLGQQPPAPGPVPSGPDLGAAFRTNDDRAEARQHARVFATICGSLADYLEYDGSRTQPLIKTGVQIDEFRRGLRQTRTKGWSFLTTYPELGPAVEQFLTREVGTSGGPISAEQRQKWITAMRQLAASSEHAARE